MDQWDFNCPKYVDLTSGVDEDPEQLEEYFDIDHEEEQNFKRITRSMSAALTASGVPAGAQGTRRQGAQSPEQSAVDRVTNKFEKQLQAEGHAECIKRTASEEHLSEDELQPELNAKSVSSTEVISSISANTGKENGTQENAQVCTQVPKKTTSQVVNSKQRHPLRVHNDIASPCNIALSKQKASVVQKPSTSVKVQTVLVRKRPAPSAVGKSAAGLSLRKGVATSAVSKPAVPTAVKKSVPPLVGKKHVVRLSARQHVRPSAIRKSAAASSVRKGASPALRKSAAPPAAQCQSLAEFVGKFHSKTPTRFRQVPKDPGGQCQGLAFKKPTIPVTPKLATQLRSRTASLRDQKRKEEHVNVCASKPKRSKVEAVQVNTWAAPVPKLALHAMKAEQNPLASNLASKPLQTKLARTATSKQVSRRVTVAKSPAFALKLRSETWKQRKQTEKSTLYMEDNLVQEKDEQSCGQELKEEKNLKKDKSKSKTGEAALRQKRGANTKLEGTKKEVTKNKKKKEPCKSQSKPVPGQSQKFCQRSKSAAPEGKKPVEKPSKSTEVEKKTSHFVARPAPDPARVFRPRNISAPPTKPKPFRLASVERHQKSLEGFRKKMEEMEIERMKAAKFVARPAPRSVRARSNSVDPAGDKERPGPSGHISRPRRR
ncbi:uncharacterized protein [Dermacentor andersoni]|uniref:uncharacterized protein n=1 Tax=Dermacentor andersoni TaxID=34620 RepID=UPI00241813AD|nr:nucleolar protein dao-5-like [Dermacentor andersoni]